MASGNDTDQPVEILIRPRDSGGPILCIQVVWRVVAIGRPIRMLKSHLLCLVATSLLIAGGGAWGASPGDTHTVGGTISGLTGKGLMLRLNSQSTSSISVSPLPGAVRFVFPTGLATGSAYAVTVQAQPVGPSQRCAVSRGQGGRIGTADVSEVMVDCSLASDQPRAGPGPDPLRPHTWDLYVDAFQVSVDIENISYSDISCSISGGPVNAKFRESPSTHGKPVGSIQWNPERPTSISIEFHVDSDATVGPQAGQSSGVPKTCEASNLHFKDKTYRMVGELRALTAPVTMTSPMPENDDTTGNHGCPGKVDWGNQCYIQYWFDNSPGTARTSVDLPTLLSTGSVDVPIRGTATNVPGYGEKRSGNYRWSGTMRLRAVQMGS